MLFTSAQHWLYEAEQMLWHLQTDNQLSRAIITFPRRQSRVFQQVLFKSLWQQWHELIKKSTSLMLFPWKSWQVFVNKAESNWMDSGHS